MNMIKARELYEKFGAGSESSMDYTLDDSTPAFAIYASGYYNVDELKMLIRDLESANAVMPQWKESKKKITIHTKAYDGGTFNCRPAMSFDLLPSEILTNNVVLPGEFNPHRVRLWIVGHEHGALCAVWASNPQDAFDNAVDYSALIDCLKDESVGFEHNEEDLTELGNASELYDLTYAWIAEAEFDSVRDAELLRKFRNAENLKSNTLEF